MPRRCSFGCEPSDAVMHCFPNYSKFPERFKTWVELCGGKLETSADYEYYRKQKVCDKHFTVSDRNRCKRLNALAVPSIYLSGIPVHNFSDILETSAGQVYTSQLSRKDTPMHNISNTLETSAGQASTSQLLTKDKVNKEHILSEHNYTAASRNRQQSVKKGPKWTPAFNCTQLKNMRTQIKQLRSDVCRLKKNGDFQARLANAKKLSERIGFSHIVQRMPKPTQLFINMQMQSAKKPKGRRFTLDEKVLSLSVYKKSPKCYALLHKYFTLPSVKAMKRLLSKIKLCPGINPIIFEKIKNTVAQKDTRDKLCSLAFDEMSVTPQINYDVNKDTLEGFASNNENQFANHALVFMIKGIQQNFKQPVAYYFTNCLKKTELKKLIKTVIRHAQDAGLIIVDTVCDQSTVNVSAINELVDDTKRAYLRTGREWRYDCFSVNGRKIIPLFDTPHLIKGIRNNLLTKDMIYIYVKK